MTDKKYSIEEVFGMIGEENLLGEHADQRNDDIEVDGYTVHRRSLRYKTFYQKGIKCVCCGREGAYFKLDIERGKDVTETNRRHFNLYADDGTLMTKDHIIPKSKGGPDRVDNMQTMCVYCNKAKGNTCPGHEKEYIIATSLSGRELIFGTFEKAAYHVATQCNRIMSKKISKEEAIKTTINCAVRLHAAIENNIEYAGYSWKKEMR